jgi:MraZ protein
VAVPLFLGQFKYVMDEKRRVNIPAVFRDQVAKEDDPTLGAIRGLDGCIYVLTKSELDHFLTNFDTGQFESEAEARRFQRWMAKGAAIGIPDAQGRITLTDDLRTYAGLKRDIIIFGNFSRIEIWDPERFEAHLAAPEDEQGLMVRMASQFFGNGSKRQG